MILSRVFPFMFAFACLPVAACSTSPGDNDQGNEAANDATYDESFLRDEEVRCVPKDLKPAESPTVSALLAPSFSSPDPESSIVFDDEDGNVCLLAPKTFFADISTSDTHIASVGLVSKVLSIPFVEGMFVAALMAMPLLGPYYKSWPTRSLNQKLEAVDQIEKRAMTLQAGTERNMQLELLRWVAIGKSALWGAGHPVERSVQQHATEALKRLTTTPSTKASKVITLGSKTYEPERENDKIKLRYLIKRSQEGEQKDAAFERNKRKGPWLLLSIQENGGTGFVPRVHPKYNFYLIEALCKKDITAVIKYYGKLGQEVSSACINVNLLSD